MELTFFKKEKTTGIPIAALQKPQRLTSSEIANIWLSYMNYSMLKCMARYFLNNVDDTDVRSIFGRVRGYL